jgi:Malectin domain
LDLVNGLVVNPTALGVTPQFNIRAVNGSLVQSVQFFPSGQKENTQPFAYCSDNAGAYVVCTDLKAGGPYTITARAYTQKNQVGIPLPDVSVTFSIAGPPAPVRALTKAPVVPARSPTKAPVSNAPITPTPPPTYPAIYINCGGSGSYIDVDRNKWDADLYFAGGTAITVPTPLEISQTLDDELYWTHRQGNVSYTIPVVNGLYTVQLLLAEFK